MEEKEELVVVVVEEEKIIEEEEEEEEKEKEKEKWVKHYSSKHQILLVGEGDFSFSLCLALAFASAFNIVSTSLDSYDAVTTKYKESTSNLESLKRLGACLLHEVDATKMKLHPDLKMRKFDSIIFNFPHADFHGKEDNALLIEMHRNLLRNFLRNSSRMLRANGEVHISHKTSATFLRWNLEELGWQNSLALFEKAPFNVEDYPGYNNKRGDGNRCDEPFPLGKCSTFKFRFSRAAKKISRLMNRTASTHPTPQAMFLDNPIQVDNGWSSSLMPGGGLNSTHEMSHQQPASSCLVVDVHLMELEVVEQRPFRVTMTTTVQQQQHGVTRELGKLVMEDVMMSIYARMKHRNCGGEMLLIMIALISLSTMNGGLTTTTTTTLQVA